MNSVHLVGRLGQDPEVKYTQGGDAWCRLSVATNDGTKDREETNWHNVVVFGKQAESCGQYLSKGSQVGVQGTIQYRKYEKDGETKHVTNIKGFRVEFLGGNSGGGGGEGRGGGPVDDDIPF